MNYDELLSDGYIEAIEVFKTNISTHEEAMAVTRMIEEEFDYQCNVDLADCDKILRVKGLGIIPPTLISGLLKRNGFEAEVLPDDLPRVAVGSLFGRWG